MREVISERINTIKAGKVPEGYKKTKLGIIPKDWIVMQIKDCLKRVDKAVDIEQKEEYVQIGVRSHGKGIFYKEPILGKELGNKRVFWIEPDCFIVNIVFAWEQAVGKTTKNEVGMIASHRFPMYKTKKEILKLDYLVQYFLTPKGKEVMEFASPGGAGRNRTLGQDRFMKSFIVCPSPAEQNKIAYILVGFNEKIDLIDRLICEKKKQMKWFVQNYVSGKKRNGKFKNNWEVTPLNEILEVNKEKNIYQKLEICSVAVKKGIIEQEKHLGRSYAADDTTNYSVVHYGDIVYTKSPTGEFPYGIIKQSKMLHEVAISPLYAVYTPKNYYLGCIIHAYFQYPENTIKYLNPLVQKGAKNTINISNQAFLNGTICIPTDITEQENIVNKLDIFEKEIELLENKLEQTKLEKKAMMQLLLSGIVRVN